MKKLIITEREINIFRIKLVEEEKCIQTIEKYIRDIRKLEEYSKERKITKQMMIQFKADLENCNQYKVSSINSFIAAANHYCEVMGHPEYKVKTIKVQKNIFEAEEKELTKTEYERLIQAAQRKGREQLVCIIQTLGSTGIRISELKYITVESLKTGFADIYNKGKSRRILYPSELRKMLKNYAVKHAVSRGSIFITKGGKAVNRSNVWKQLKVISLLAGVNPSKVFPHNMRHLFARSFYSIKKDIARLADVLGHSSIETTRIYVKSSGKEHRKLLDSMKMVFNSTYISRNIRNCSCIVKSTT